MTDRGRPRVEVRALDDAARRRSTRSLTLAMVVSGLLLVAIVLVGLAASWPWWVLAATGVVPFAVGLYALRAIVVLNRARSAA